MSNLTTFDPNDGNEDLFLQAQKSLQESQLSLFKIVKKIDNDIKVREKKVESIDDFKFGTSVSINDYAIIGCPRTSATNSSISIFSSAFFTSSSIGFVSSITSLGSPSS